MRLTDALTRCAAAVRRTAGQIARTVARVVRQTVTTTIRSVRMVARASTTTSRRRSLLISGLASALALPLYVAACSRADAPTPPATIEAAVAPTPSPIVPAEPEVERKLGEFQLTFYYVIGEDEVDPSRVARRGAAKVANDNAIAGMSADAAALVATLPDLVPVYDRTCAPLTNVSRAFAGELAMQGTGRLRDGRILNVAGPCACPRTPCYHVLPSHRKWGMGGSGMPLEPFRTVAVDPRKVKLGSLLYIPELDGQRMPGPAGVGGFIHDGCVVAGDTGGGIQGSQLDLFVARRAYYKGLARRGGSHGWARHVDVFDGKARCQRTGGKVSRSAAGSI